MAVLHQRGNFLRRVFRDLSVSSFRREYDGHEFSAGLRESLGRPIIGT